MNIIQKDTWKAVSITSLEAGDTFRQSRGGCDYLMFEFHRGVDKVETFNLTNSSVAYLDRNKKVLPTKAVVYTSLLSSLTRPEAGEDMK